MCDRWKSFENFLADMGEKPSGLSIDRIDNSNGYEPGNCRWASPKAQGRNKRNNRILTAHGVTGCMSELCEHFNLSYQMVANRINALGWSIEDAFTP